MNETNKKAKTGYLYVVEECGPMCCLSANKRRSNGDVNGPCSDSINCMFFGLEGKKLKVTIEEISEYQTIDKKKEGHSSQD